jgi:hypothetical protein
MGIITSGSALSALRPGIHDWWGLGYKLRPEQFSKIFEMLTTSLNYERDVNMYGLGLAKVRPEGAPTEMDEMGEGFKYDYIPLVYSSGTKITQLAVLNNQYMRMGEEATKELGNSMRETKERVMASFLNLAFSNTRVYADGNPLCYSAHLLAGGGTFSNVPALDADLSEAMLEEACTNIRSYTDDRGKKRIVMAKQAIVHPKWEFEIQRILNSDLRVGTADNDINVLKSGRYLPGGYVVYDYLTDENAWFVQTDCPKGLRYFQKQNVQFSEWVDNLTDNINIKAIEEYSGGCTDVMAIYGCQGG